LEEADMKVVLLNPMLGFSSKAEVLEMLERRGSMVWFQYWFQVRRRKTIAITIS